MLLDAVRRVVMRVPMRVARRVARETARTFDGDAPVDDEGAVALIALRRHGRPLTLLHLLVAHQDSRT